MRDAEVGHLHAAVAGEQHVLGGHVAMHDAAVVGRLQGGQQVALDGARRGRRESALAPDALLQRLARHVLHHDVRGSRRAAAVVDGDHVGVVQGGGGPRLAVKASHELLVVGEALAQDLDRHQPVQGGVARQEDLGHAAAAQAPHHAVAAGDQPAVRRIGGAGRGDPSRGADRGARAARSAGCVGNVWIVRDQTKAPRR